MNAPDKIYLHGYEFDKTPCDRWDAEPTPKKMFGYKAKFVAYIRKDALLDYLQKELERLWELIPDASNEAPTQMEMRYLGEYVATERLIDEIESL